jgi:hypothetical protein
MNPENTRKISFRWCPNPECPGVPGKPQPLMYVVDMDGLFPAEGGGRGADPQYCDACNSQLVDERPAGEVK